MKKLIVVLALLGGLSSLGFATSTNVQATNTPSVGDVLYYGGVTDAGHPNAGTWNSLPTLVQQVINNETIIPATVGSGVNGATPDTVGNLNFVGTGLQSTVSGSGSTAVSNVDFSNLSTVEGQTNAANIAAETTRATGAESTLQSNLNTVDANHTAAETTLSNSITNETNRATSAEGALGSAIGAETSRATSAESALGSSISNETVRAQNAEATNAAAISNETGRATSAEGALGSAIGAETSRATAAESSLAGGLANESAVRANADQVLQNNINTVDSNSVARDNVLQNNINGETNRAKGAEGVLQNNIDKEASARAAGDAALQNQVNGINARTADAERRIDRLEETKYLLEPTVRLYDSKRWQVQAFDSYDVRHGMNFALGARVMLKLGKSYEEKLLEKTNPEIARLLAANVQKDSNRMADLEKQLSDNRKLIADQAALLNALSAKLSGLKAVDVNLAAQSGNDEDLLNAMEKRAEGK